MRASLPISTADTALSPDSILDSELLLMPSPLATSAWGMPIASLACLTLSPISAMVITETPPLLLCSGLTVVRAVGASM